MVGIEVIHPYEKATKRRRRLNIKNKIKKKRRATYDISPQELSTVGPTNCNTHPSLILIFR
jgi:hypothetical protein